MERLEDPAITRVAIGDEFHAPYGRAAYAALRWLKVYDKVKGKLVVGENISQTAQFVESGNAQMGFISSHDGEQRQAEERRGSTSMVPEVYPKIRAVCGGDEEVGQTWRRPGRLWSGCGRPRCRRI